MSVGIEPEGVGSADVAVRAGWVVWAYLTSFMVAAVLRFGARNPSSVCQVRMRLFRAGLGVRVALMLKRSCSFAATEVDLNFFGMTQSRGNWSHVLGANLKKHSQDQVLRLEYEVNTDRSALLNLSLNRHIIYRVPIARPSLTCRQPTPLSSFITYPHLD